MITTDFEATFIRPLEEACNLAQRLVANQGGGRYGGRYVVRVEDVPFFSVLSHDDPERITDEDVFAQVTATAVYPIGHARYYLGKDGKVDRKYFES